MREESGVDYSFNVHRLENIGYRVQSGLLIWTNRQDIRTLKEFQSMASEIYSASLDDTRRMEGADEHWRRKTNGG